MPAPCVCIIRQVTRWFHQADWNELSVIRIALIHRFSVLAPHKCVLLLTAEVRWSNTSVLNTWAEKACTQLEFYLKKEKSHYFSGQIINTMKTLKYTWLWWKEQHPFQLNHSFGIEFLLLENQLCSLSISCSGFILVLPFCFSASSWLYSADSDCHWYHCTFFPALQHFWTKRFIL